MSKLSLVAILTLLPGATLAECAGVELLSCPIAGSKKHLEMCLDGRDLTYAFGPEGAPELQLSARLEDGTYLPWQGVGRSVHEEVAFTNADYSYLVYWSMDRLDPNQPVTGGVTILKNDSFVADVACAPGSVGEAFEPILQKAMLDIGLCWDHEIHGWARCD